MRREIPMAITFVVGVTFALAYFIPHPPFNKFEAYFTDWFMIVAAFAIWLGALNLIKVSLVKIFKSKTDIMHSSLVVISFLLIVFWGFYDGFRGFFSEPAYSFRDQITSFNWLYINVFMPLSMTMFALLAFFVASASYRAFRARNIDATLLLLAAFFVMMGRVPLGDMITSWLPAQYQMSQWASWIMQVMNTAGQRAIMIGIALGLVSTSIRIILGLERSYLGGE